MSYCNLTLCLVYWGRVTLTIWYTSAMKATNDKVKELLKSVIGLKLWNARQTVGIKFELGKEVEKGRSEYHFWIFCSHWWLKKGKGRDCEDIVNSESNKNNIEKKVKILNDKKLIEVEYHEDGKTTFFDFEDDMFLHVAPYGSDKEDQPQWQLFTDNEIVTLQQDGDYRVEPNE